MRRIYAGDRQHHGKRPVGRQRHHVREVPAPSTSAISAQPAVRSDAARTTRIGTQLLIAERHGNVRNAELLVHTLRPRAIVTNNGTRKGGQPEAMKIFYSSPGMEDVWQIHFSELAGQERACPGSSPPTSTPSSARRCRCSTRPVAPPRRRQSGTPLPVHDGTGVLVQDFGGRRTAALHHVRTRRNGSARIVPAGRAR